MPPRRSHKKSRGGCTVCKQRHLKCDEARPSCTQCINSARECDYQERQINIILSAGIEEPFPATFRSDDSLPPPDAVIQGQPTPSPHDALTQDQPVNMLHIKLLHHFSTQTLEYLHENASEIDLSFSEMMKQSLAAPYLMNELLAISALHLSTTCAERRDYYRHHAIQLQTHALNIFHGMKSEVNANTVVPHFLFSSVLGLHMLCDTLIYREGDFDLFLDSFVHYLRVHRGARAVTGGHWSLLTETPLGPILKDKESRLGRKTGFGQECRRVLELIRKSDLDASTIHVYERIIESLQMAMAASKSDEDQEVNSLGIFTWPVIVPVEYIDLLVDRKPEALVILSHYAVLLHFRRDTWMFGESGQFLIQSINQYLGPGWAEWLAWPNFVLASVATAGRDGKTTNEKSISPFQ